MSKKKRIIITIILAVMVIVGIIITALLNDKDENSEPMTPDASSQEQAQSTDEGHDDHDHQAGDEMGTDVHMHDVPDLIINGESLTNDQVNSRYKSVAEKAAYEYVFQQTSESASSRQKRLRSVFTNTSPAIAAPKPKVDLSNSPNTTANPIILDSRWEMNGKTLIFTVSLRVIVRSDDQPHDEVSDIYQAYDVQFMDVNGQYQPHAISFSSKPVIIKK